MAKTTFKDQELRNVIAEMTEQLDVAWQTSKKDLLAKALPEESKEGGGEPSAPPSADPASSDSSAPASDPAASAPAPDASAAPAMGAPAGAPGAAPAMGDPAAQQDAPLTPEALQAEYSQLAPEELDMHIKAALSAKEALAASASAVAPDAASAGGPPAGAPPMAMKAEIGGHDTAEQSDSEDTVDKGEQSLAEDTVDKGELHSSYNKNSGGKMVKKSETSARDAEMTELKKSLQTAREDVENLTKAVKMVLERPERKAITTIAALTKSEPVLEKKEFTADEARAKLSALVPKLSKAEREIMFDYYAGKAKVEQLASIFEAHNVSPKK